VFREALKGVGSVEELLVFGASPLCKSRDPGTDYLQLRLCYHFSHQKLESCSGIGCLSYAGELCVGGPPLPSSLELPKCRRTWVARKADRVFLT